MNLPQRIKAFTALGNHLATMTTDEKEALYYRAKSGNQWFTTENIDLALSGIQQYLSTSSLENWTKHYDIKNQGLSIGIVMAGNIPLVGFHDLLCVLISGNQALVKTSSQDDVLSRFIIDQLIEIEPAFANQIQIVERLKHMDAVIATGSDNSARYFEFYFSKIPHIIRKNRSSCAVLNGSETAEEIHLLGQDIFQYFGLGCRNVSKVFAPQHIDWVPFLDGLAHHDYVANHHKYVNNYDYQKSILLVNRVHHLDTGFLLLQESNQLVSPISVLYFETYQDQTDLQSKLQIWQDKIQCISSKNAWWPESVPFGKAQQPELTDYADGIDTLQFLCSL